MTENVAGQRFGRLVTIRRIQRRLWLFQCDCGRTVERDISHLRYTTKKGHIASCGCINGEAAKSALIGQHFGMLTAIRMVERRSGRGNLWLFQCDCGKEVVRTGAQVKSHTREGHLASCGCTKPGMKPRGEAARFSVLDKCKAGARDRGLPFLLTDEQAYALFEQPCHYCGEKPHVRYTHRFNGSYPHNGIDRKDSSRGYTVKNCVPCCPTCNFMKRARPYEEWAAWLDRVTAFRSRRNND